MKLFLGLFVCWLPLLGITIVSRWAPMGRQILFKRLRKKLKIGAKIVFAFCLVAGGIALLFGLLFDLVFLTPLRVPLHQSPISRCSSYNFDKNLQNQPMSSSIGRLAPSTSKSPSLLRCWGLIGGCAMRWRRFIIRYKLCYIVTCSSQSDIL